MRQSKAQKSEPEPPLLSGVASPARGAKRKRERSPGKSPKPEAVDVDADSDVEILSDPLPSVRLSSPHARIHARATIVYVYFYSCAFLPGPYESIKGKERERRRFSVEFPRPAGASHIDSHRISAFLISAIPSQLVFLSLPLPNLLPTRNSKCVIQLFFLEFWGSPADVVSCLLSN